MIPIPDFFQCDMTGGEKHSITLLVHQFDLFPTGSRLFCRALARETSDFDLFFRANLDQIKPLETDWRSDSGLGSMEEDFADEDRKQRFVSLKNGRINLIAIMDDEFFDLFSMATDICKMIGGPPNKRDRIKIFRRILYKET